MYESKSNDSVRDDRDYGDDRVGDDDYVELMMVIVQAKEIIAVWYSWWDLVSGYKWAITMSNASNRGKDEGVKDKRNKVDSGYDGWDAGGDDEDDDLNVDNKSMIVMGLRWDMASKYQMEMTIIDGNDGWWILFSVEMTWLNE